ncbi:uncharacterized protein LOC114327960 isoform X2 [Diabrotica virgifera virgifera]|uniref:CHK kinase-like domain-containing protein n=1 Tax=Diabrotica virgifera virgifera TaxID=50390 RepID=A0ABM5IGW8_DIAVI|nr:uncharacterized protein LOC114327960 isoform X2 [Diabrotica virgifera virgifera]
MDSNEKVNSKELVGHWVKQFMTRRRIQEYQIVDDISTIENCGYLSDINLVTVSYLTENNKPETLNLIVKHDFYKKSPLIALAFRIETHIYKTVLETFNQFLESKNLPSLNVIPRYFDSFTDENAQVIITENIVKLGYRLMDRIACADMNHCYVLLEAYAKFHALSFALKDQQPEKFKALCDTEEFYSVYIDDQRDSIRKDITEINKLFKRKGDEDLANKLEQELKNRFTGKISLDSEEEQAVFVHGDNWNHNHMFLYDDNGCQIPNSVMLLDWQLSGIRSPAQDLSNFLFLTCSQKELNQLENLLHIYHDALTDRLKLLGSSTNLFTFDDLKRHWKEHSSSGLLSMVIDLNIAVKEDQDSDVMESAEILFYQRAKAAVSTYFKYQEIF